MHSNSKHNGSKRRAQIYFMQISGVLKRKMANDPSANKNISDFSFSYVSSSQIVGRGWGRATDNDAEIILD